MKQHFSILRESDLDPDGFAHLLILKIHLQLMAHIRAYLCELKSNFELEFGNVVFFWREENRRTQRKIKLSEQRSRKPTPNSTHIRQNEIRTGLTRLVLVKRLPKSWYENLPETRQTVSDT